RTALSQFTPMTPFNMETPTHFPLPPPTPVTLLKQNDNLFADDLSQFGHTKIENHHIPIEVSISVRQRAYH
ncbi:8261_t:CDS:2, partial [Funneliformis geosporum]